MSGQGHTGGHGSTGLWQEGSQLVSMHRVWVLPPGHSRDWPPGPAGIARPEPPSAHTLGCRAGDPRAPGGGSESGLPRRTGRRHSLSVLSPQREVRGVGCAEGASHDQGRVRAGRLSKCSLAGMVVGVCGEGLSPRLPRLLSRVLTHISSTLTSRRSSTWARACCRG